MHHWGYGSLAYGGSLTMRSTHREWRTNPNHSNAKATCDWRQLTAADYGRNHSGPMPEWDGVWSERAVCLVGVWVGEVVVLAAAPPPPPPPHPPTHTHTKPPTHSAHTSSEPPHLHTHTRLPTSTPTPPTTPPNAHTHTHHHHPPPQPPCMIKVDTCGCR